MPTLAGKKQTLPSISSFTDRVFSIFRRKKVRVRSVGNRQQTDYSRTDTLKKTQTKIKQISIQGKNATIKWNYILKYDKIEFIKLKRFILHAASIKPLLGTKLVFFLALSTFLLFHASLWPERSAATT